MIFGDTDFASNRHFGDLGNGDLFLREDDIPDTIQQRLNIYHQQTEPVIEYYTQRGMTEIIDAKGSIEDIKTNIIERISGYNN